MRYVKDISLKVISKLEHSEHMLYALDAADVNCQEEVKHISADSLEAQE
jgi:hypothetical protein